MPIARSTEVDALGVINLIGTNLIDRYPPRSILKELLQNADDADAETVVVGWTPGLGGSTSHQLLKGPALFVINDGKFTAEDAHAICRFGQNYKYGDKAVIGKFGLGLKSVFHLCEAFFYLSSASPGQADDDGLFNNLASPWKDTEYHRGWNTVRVEDLHLLRDFLQPICSELGPFWFALWLPLRRADHCNGQRFSARQDGDESACPAELLDGLTERGITRSLPLLHSVRTIHAWKRWELDVTDRPAMLTLAPDSGRSLFRDYVKHIEDAAARHVSPECFKTRYGANRTSSSGRYEVIGSNVTTTVIYALEQSWSSELLQLRKESDWPMSFVLTGGQQPDKAQPHGAVVLGRRVDSNNGGLDVSWAVFLPIETAAYDHSKSEFLLTLHGCFFVDAGRRHALHSGDDVRGVWNRRLTSKGVLPLIVPAVDSLAKSSDADLQMVRRLTRAIAEWVAKDGTLPFLGVASAESGPNAVSKSMHFHNGPPHPLAHPVHIEDKPRPQRFARFQAIRPLEDYPRLVVQALDRTAALPMIKVGQNAILVAIVQTQKSIPVQTGCDGLLPPGSDRRCGRGPVRCAVKDFGQLPAQCVDHP
jgi:hypothetical protein